MPYVVILDDTVIYGPFDTLHEAEQWGWDQVGAQVRFLPLFKPEP